jgi:hypothetical protein
MKDQEQKSGDNSTNLQAGRDIVVHGLTYTETKDLVKTEAQEVFKQNSLVLANEAYNLVLSRSEELLDSFLKKLEAKKPEAIEAMRDPGMQYSLFNAQKEYSKTGDKDLADLLEDILVERAQNPKRDLMQIVLDECVSVAPKLTPDQFDALSLIFILRYSMNHGVVNQKALIQYAVLHLLPFQAGIREEQSRYQHLEFSGCGSLGISSVSIEHAFRQNYMILFSKGFTIEEYEQRVSDDEKFKKYIAPCQQDKTKFQINIINQEQVKVIGKTDNLTEDEVAKINGIYNTSTMNDQEVKEYLIKLFPPFEKLIEDWNKSSIKNMTLTSVGIAIGQANITRKTKQPYDLKIWIK